MAAPAWAVDWTLESAGVAERVDAARVEEVALRSGFDARVVRRFADGVGWRYLTRIEGFADAGSAGAAARQLAEATGVTLVVLQHEADRVVPIEEVRPPPVKSAGAAPAEPASVESILAEVARAHGTGAETLEALATRPVLLRYRRVLPDGRAVRQVWARGPAGTYLEVTPEAGSAGIRPSRTLLTADRAVLSVDGSAWTAQDLAKSTATLEAFGPVELLSLLLSVAGALEERPEFARMTRVPGSAGAAPVLRYGGDTVTGPIELELDEARRIRRVSFDDGGLVRELEDYRPIAGLDHGVVPWRITTLRDGRADRIEIEAFEVGAELPDAWFRSDDRTGLGPTP